MDDPHRVHRREGARELPADLDHLGERRRIEIRHGLASPQLHRYEGSARRRARPTLDQGRNRRVAEGRQDARLTVEAAALLGIVGRLIAEDLEGDVAPRVAVVGAVDLSLGADPEHLDDLVAVVEELGLRPLVGRFAQELRELPAEGRGGRGSLLGQDSDRAGDQDLESGRDLEVGTSGAHPQGSERARHEPRT